MRLDRYIISALLLVSVVFFGYFILISDGFHGGGDSIAHYRLAKFSWQHPIYLLDHWGKPVFTLIAMPFAQFGFKAVEFMNLFFAVFASALVYLIGRFHRWKLSWLAAPLVLFSPIFMQQYFSGLTETVFICLLLLAFWLKLKNQRTAALVVFSFLPFIRTEALLLLFWFGFLEVAESKDRRPVLFMLTGFVVYSLIGWIAKGDINWIANELPYVGGENIYGSGSIWHYVQLMPDTVGIPLLVVTIVGIILSIPKSVVHASDADWLWKYAIVPSLIYVGFHSFMWYVGKVSLGLSRMLAVVVPLFALVSIYGVSSLQRSVRSLYVRGVVSTVVAFICVVYGLKSFELPVKLGEEERVLQNVAEYIRSNNLVGHKIHYYALYNEITLGLDPHNADQCQQVVHNRANPHEEVKPGSLVIWDAHFSPNEGAMPLENLLGNKHFEVLQVFEPETPFNTLGNRPFEVYLFLRKPDVVSKR